MVPLVWILSAGMFYLTAWSVIVMVAEAIRFRDVKLFGWVVVALLPGFLVGMYVRYQPPFDYCISLAIALLGIFIAYRLLIRNTDDVLRLRARKAFANHTVLHLVLLTGCFIFLMPFVWLLTTSLKEEDEMVKYPPVWIPTRQVQVMVSGQPHGLSTIPYNGRTVRVAEMEDLEDGSKTVQILPGQPGAGSQVHVDGAVPTKIRRFGLKWQNYSDALNYLPAESKKGLVYLWNTVFVTIMCILGTLISSSLVAYSFARLRWPGKDILFGVLLATMMIPGAVTMAPVFLVYRKLGMINTLYPLWLQSFLGGPFSIFLLRQFFMTIPKELEEAAKIDGAGYFTIYWRIMLPLIKPALAALTIMTFMGSWNNFMGPLIYINSPEKMTLAYALQLFQGQYGSEYGMVMAASTMVVLPVIVVFFLAQKHFIEGVTLTGIKG
jgi:multiple sugar transport system permease protein